MQARQKGRCIFTTTISFVRDSSGEDKQVSHAQKLPEGVAETVPNEDGGDNGGEGSPFVSKRIELGGDAEKDIWNRKIRIWQKAKGKISAKGGRKAQLNALAYMTDSYFIGTVSRVHQLWRFPLRPSEVHSLPANHRKAVMEDSCGPDGMSLEEWEDRPQVGMQVSLDHSIYFHEPRRVKADEWMFVEMESPWAGDGRGVVTQRVWSKDGTLLATCFQEVSLVSSQLPLGLCLVSCPF